ncbi:hypothetical protein [Rothia terrae]|uniref:Uncharacterized protein n=1 Tax=Rothia terrae TaxID=396015 RepID=A0A7S7AZH1_9MICC|nr:hypothetical protein [Rothia terrae]QOW64705.1 hypothetical protein IDM49_11420 [Rothia terrae]
MNKPSEVVNDDHDSAREEFKSGISLAKDWYRDAGKDRDEDSEAWENMSYSLINKLSHHWQYFVYEIATADNLSNTKIKKLGNGTASSISEAYRNTGINPLKEVGDSFDFYTYFNQCRNDVAHGRAISPNPSKHQVVQWMDAFEALADIYRK